MTDGRRWNALPILAFADWDIVPAYNTEPARNTGFYRPGSQQGGDG